MATNEGEGIARVVRPIPQRTGPPDCSGHGVIVASMMVVVEGQDACLEEVDSIKRVRLVTTAIEVDGRADVPLTVQTWTDDHLQ